MLTCRALSRFYGVALRPAPGLPWRPVGSTNLQYRELIKPLVTDTPSVKSHEKYWREETGYLDLLHKLFPSGKTEGPWFRVGAEGDAGRRMVFNVETGKWTDHADEDAGKDLGSKGIVSFVWYLEGWDGIRRLAMVEELPFDWVIYNGMSPDERPIYQFATKRGLMVARKWEYKDADGTYLGTRVRLENREGEKEFRLLSYRTRKVTRDPGGKRTEYPEGWRLDNEWGGIHPIYNYDKIMSSNKPILWTEGEKAADAAEALVGDEYVTATWGGGSTSKIIKAAFGLIPKDRDNFYWPDKDDPGKRTVSKMVDPFPSIKLIDVWAIGELKKGDDLADLADRGLDASWAAEQIKRAVFASATVGRGGVSHNYVYVIKTEEFVHKDTGHRLSPKALARAHAHEIEGLDEELLSDPRTQKVYTMTYWPGMPQIVQEEDERGNLIDKINLWREGGCESLSGDCPAFANHINHLITDSKVREHFLDYMAYIVQKPGHKINFALLLMGSQGIGKSYLVEVLRQCLGRSNVVEVTSDQLDSDFNPWMAEAQVIAIEEVMAGGRREVTNRLKPMITSPTSQINDKNTKLFSIPNRVNLILFSNEDDPLVLDNDDRRFLVYKTSFAKQSDQYYIDLFESLSQEGPQIKYLFETRDLSNFNPKGSAPFTDSKADLISAGESPTLTTLRMYVNSRRTPFDRDVVSTLDVCDWIRANLRSAGRYDSAPKNVKQMLAKMGAKNLGDQEVNGERCEAWAIRNQANF